MSQIAKITAFLVLALAVANPAEACSENLYRVGKGKRYREYTAPVPGNILMVADNADSRVVAEWLTHAGHKVQLVESAARLGTFLETDKYDMVLASYGVRDEVEAQTNAAASHARYLPFADEKTGEATMARERYRETVSLEPDPREILKAINKTLKTDSNIKVGM